VRHAELWGSRKGKYEALWKDGLTGGAWERLSPHAKYQMFYQIDNALLDNYDKWLSVGDIFQLSQIGMTTSRDHIAVDFSGDELLQKMELFRNLTKDDQSIRGHFFAGVSAKEGRLPGDTASWKLSEARAALKGLSLSDYITPISYRPLDNRSVFYSDIMVERSRADAFTNIVGRDNISLSFNRKIDEERPFYDVFVFDRATQLHSLSLKESNYLAPLYVFDPVDQSRRINFDPKIYADLRAKATDATHPEPDEVQVFDYIYGVLHCPAYRATYAEFLKIDFPRIPWPASPAEFHDIATKGTSLRKLHLMDPTVIGPTPYPFTGNGTDVVEKPEYRDGKVWINPTQYFDAAPAVSWGFYIGGYQPAQKWLKDRKGRVLTYDDQRHYQRILKILAETDRIMQTITMTLGPGQPLTNP
jgi:predicted helicase